MKAQLNLFTELLVGKNYLDFFLGTFVLFEVIRIPESKRWSLSNTE